MYLSQDASTITITHVSSHKQPHRDADAYRLLESRLALSLTPRTYPSYHKARTPITPTKLPLYPQMDIDMSTYTRPEQECCEPITPTKLPASPQSNRHESQTPARAGTKSNLLPLQNCRRTHNHVHVYPARPVLGGIEVEFITPSKLPASPQSRPARVFAQYRARISPPPITPSKLPIVPALAWKMRLLSPSKTKSIVFAFGKILCSPTSAVDTRVGRPSRRPARRAASGSRVNPSARPGGPGGCLGVPR